ncbi:Cupin domain protein [Gimesia panareensis]|uniref:Cupin domain protein n=1 Tax=Gimesia panareensis TaxID=2527978 RepID=A0A518FQ65_9PLAN|nr:cupin domain-containing protein [Gimesia panareensis]QDV18430.1 Cupin domain protein [Gimesia panareensis]
MDKEPQPLSDASHLYEVERTQFHAQRPGFRIIELQISPTQSVPWHYHNHIQDTFYVIEGALKIYVQDPEEEITLAAGETFSVRPRRPHLVTNAGTTSTTFLVLQGIGEYDFVPLNEHGQ